MATRSLRSPKCDTRTSSWWQTGHLDLSSRLGHPTALVLKVHGEFCVCELWVFDVGEKKVSCAFILFSELKWPKEVPRKRRQGLRCRCSLPLRLVIVTALLSLIMLHRTCFSQWGAIILFKFIIILYHKKSWKLKQTLASPICYNLWLRKDVIVVT